VGRNDPVYAHMNKRIKKNSDENEKKKVREMAPTNEKEIFLEMCNPHDTGWDFLEKPN
jgi:hypothetical protein